MSTRNQTTITKDIVSNHLTVVRAFNAPMEQVWKAWTESKLLDQWWAPKPYQAKTKTMDFREGGYWLYLMQAPDGTGEYCRVDYQTIVPKEQFISRDYFCDADGKMNKDFPVMNWNTRFSSIGSETTVQVDLTFPSKEDMEKIIAMGFEEGFTAGLGNLDELLAKK